MKIQELEKPATRPIFDIQSQASPFELSYSIARNTTVDFWTYNYVNVGIGHNYLDFRSCRFNNTENRKV